MNKNVFYLLVFLSVFLSSCTVLFNSHQKSSLVPQTKGTNIEIANLGQYSSNYYTEIGQDSMVYKLSNLSSNYLVRLKKENYLTKTHLISRRKFNVLRIFDFAVPIIFDIIFINSIIEDQEEVIIPSFFLGTLGWTGAFFGSWRIYDKKYLLPGLDSIKQRSEDEKFIVVDKVNLDISPENYTWNYFDDYKKFLKGDMLHSSQANEKIEIKDVTLNKHLNEELSESGYIDTNMQLFSKSYNTLKLTCDITAIEENKIGNLLFIELVTNWKLINQFSNVEVLNKKIVSESNLNIYYRSSNEEYMIKHITQALDVSLFELLSDTALLSHLLRVEQSFSEKYDNWDSLDIRNTNRKTSSLTDATKSVVTIKSKNGHGSGSLISSDGYIITNYHVTGDKAGDIKVVFEDGEEYDCKIIRTNPIYDLSLLKVEETKYKPLIVGLNEIPDLGIDVYAIGTPSDIELGQTITKGIISGKRKINDIVYIQTDVSINPGNSGGALVDQNGVLIGIVNSKIVGYGVEGLGFVIPANNIEKALKINILYK